MKIKGFLFIASVICSFSARSGWVVSENLYTVDTKEPMGIAFELQGNFSELRDLYVGLSFAFPERYIFTHLTGHIDSMKWENDEKCAVANPERIEQRVLTQVDFEAYEIGKPDEISPGFIHSAFPMPCAGEHAKQKVNYSISYMGKVYAHHQVMPK